MNGTWQGITLTLFREVPLRLNGLLAQSTPVPAAETAPATNNFAFDNIFSNLGLNLGSSLVDLIKAILALVVGLIVASLAAAAVRGLLNRTDIDNRLAAWITGRQGAEDGPPVEKWISSVVFWLIMLFAIVASLQTLKLTAVAGPLNTLLEQVTQFIPKLVSAAILLGIAWVLATLTKLVVTRGLRALRLDERLGEQTGGPTPGGTTPGGTTPGGTTPGGTTPRTNQYSLSDTLGNALYWFIFLLFLPLILDALQLQQALGPVNNLLNQILAAVPNILTAIVIGAAGWLLAQVVRRIVTNLLTATGTDRLGARFGISRATGGQTLSWLIGTIVFVLILIPTAIAALNALGIAAISVPAIAMLTQILNAIPLIFTAALILGLAYVVGHFVAELVTNILTSVGFNNIFYWLGLQPRPYTRATPILPAAPEAQRPPTGQDTVLQQPTPPTRTPSELAGIVVLVGIMLFATVAATNILQIPALTLLVSGIVVILGRILAGLVVFAIGLYLANLAFNLITSSGTRQSRILGQTARIAIIALVSAMALQQMGIASDIVNLAFGLLLGAIAVAIALAFGLGSRDVAAGQVREWLASFKEDKTPR
ncbi:mechanosensitive ion channel [Coleofasciculus sp. FACHB-SPT9]|uniref:mechanosensitive ion channel n=1 Tax=Cyanophyceae TaxID=3028117 RepID=UPI0016887B8D|nr:mechanosensitive ion channel [Coleofasciculus sp. FACHB-SPT9]MBD1890329.1 mechanosensitive ion channel [Coleofasciculus sp. FACHB-SPT9]